jgi:subtilisin family serine protease
MALGTRLAAALAILLIPLHHADAQPGPMAGSPPTTMLGERAIVVIPEVKANNAYLRPIIEAHGYPVVVETPISGAMLVRVPPGLEDGAAELFRGMMGVRAAGRERLTRAASFECSATPVMSSPFNFPGPSATNDADFVSQWYLQNTGQVIVNGDCATDPLNTQPGVPGIDINVRNAWAITQGCEDIVVAVFDTGIQYEHPSFDYNRFFFPDLAATCPSAHPADPWSCCDDAVPGPPYTPATCEFGHAIDTGSHGTIVASIIGAQGNNQNPIAGYPEISGVDLNCKILSVRVSVQRFFGTLPYTYFSEFATLYALEEIASNLAYENVRVINMSFQYGCELFPDPIYDEIEVACQLLADQGRVIVAISSNLGLEKADELCPARWDSVITIAGIDNTGNRWDQAQWDCVYSSGTGASVDFCAPARGLLTARCDPVLPQHSVSSPPESPCDVAYNAFGSGTSGAAPQVAGVVSLLLARAAELNIALENDETYHLLFLGSRRLPHWPLSERDDSFGWGLVDAYQTLMALELLYYRPFNRADLTDHNVPNTWRFGVADGVTDCDDLDFFVDFAYPNQVVEKADFTTSAVGPGHSHWGVPDGLVTTEDYIYYTTLLFPAAYPQGCPP